METKGTLMNGSMIETNYFGLSDNKRLMSIIDLA